MVESEEGKVTQKYRFSMITNLMVTACNFAKAGKMDTMMNHYLCYQFTMQFSVSMRKIYVNVIKIVPVTSVCRCWQMCVSPHGSHVQGGQSEPLIRA